MAIHSIDYLNARRARLAASGGTNYARMAGELLHEQVRLVFADFRAWFAESTNALRSGNIADDAQSIPF
jgi:hypothetical protein